MTATVSQTETYIACLTPPGSAAIACLALFGPQAWKVVRERFRTRSPADGLLPLQPETGTVWLGRLGDFLKDDVVVAVKKVEPVPLVEVQCHGGREVVRMLTEQFEAQGVRACPWQTFQLLISADPIAARAIVALTCALTFRTAAILLDQQQGAMTRALEQLNEFWREGRDREAGLLLAELNRWTDLGRHLTTPWRVAVCGAPNVGKSSLVNALAGFQRCIVTDIPGTTRDVVTTLIAVDGWPVELSDTAGLREGGATLEKEGMELSRQAAAEADLCLWVLDASHPPIFPDVHAANIRLVVNKTDLPAAWELGSIPNAACISAKTGTGLAQLCQVIAEALVPAAPMPGEPVPFTASLCAAIAEAHRLHTAGMPEMARTILQAERDGVQPAGASP